jgi:hypothetical protein
MRIFLSHQSRRKPLVREFKSHLPTFLDTWLDEESLTWGDSFPQELKSTIQSSVDFLIIFLDNDALSSPWVKQELEWAIEREKELGRPFVIPIMLEHVASGCLPPDFSDRLSLRLPDYSKSSVEALAKQASEQLFHLVVKSFSAIQLELPRDDSVNSKPQGVPNLGGTWTLSRKKEDGELIDEGPLEIKQDGQDILCVHTDSNSGRVFKYSGFISSGQVILTFEEEGGEGYVMGSMIFRVDAQRKRMLGRSLYWRHDDNRMSGEDYVAIRE